MNQRPTLGGIEMEKLEFDCDHPLCSAKATWQLCGKPAFRFCLHCKGVMDKVAHEQNKQIEWYLLPEMLLDFDFGF